MIDEGPTRRGPSFLLERELLLVGFGLTGARGEEWGNNTSLNFLWTTPEDLPNTSDNRVDDLRRQGQMGVNVYAAFLPCVAISQMPKMTTATSRTVTLLRPAELQPE